MILAIANQKGGVGKTTTAVTLAHGLARRGRRVLLIDLDAQGNVADALGLRKTGGLYQLLVVGGGRVAVRASGRNGLDVVLGDKTTAEAKQILAGHDFREQAIKKAIAAFDYEYIILDTAPGVDVLQVGAFVACTEFLIPVSLSHLALVGAGDALASAASLAHFDALGGRFLGVLPTFWDRQTLESHKQLVTLGHHFEHLVWPPIPVDVKAREAPGHGKTLWEYAPACRALDGAALRTGGVVGGYRAVLERLEDEN